LTCSGDGSHGTDPQSIARYVAAEAHPGAILLFHVLIAARGPEREALPIVLYELSKRGYRFTSVTGLLASAKVKAGPMRPSAPGLDP
jgi:peptidoglycan/xylan/chitin deacetylase (PgdA/CDA1 family)